MSLTLELLENLYAEHILIEIKDYDVKQAELISQKYVNQTGKNHAYINSIVSNCFIKWMEENLDLEHEEIIRNIPEIWNFVNGSFVTFNHKKLILIPSDVISLDEIVIPQEWVDIPNWAGDYYLPVRIDLDEKYLHIWGYVSRKTLLEKHEYNATYCNYYVDADYLINEVDLLWIACKMFEEKGNFKPLVNLRENEAQILIKEYREEMKNSPYSPRLTGDFQKWCALLNNPQWLKELIQEDHIIIDLGKWLDDQFEQAMELGWRLVSDLFAKPQTLNTLSAVKKSVKRAKLINLQGEKEQKSVILVLEIKANTQGKYEVLIQVYPSRDNRYLPVNLSLTAIDLQSGVNIQTVISKQRNNLIQLKFSCDDEDKFKVKVTLEGVSMSEDFCI